MLIQGRRVSYRSFDSVLRAAENTRKRGKVRHRSNMRACRCLTLMHEAARDGSVEDS